MKIVGSGRRSLYRSEEDRALVQEWILGSARAGHPATVSTFIDTSFGPTHVLASAASKAGEQIVFLHGWGCNGGFWLLSGGIAGLVQSSGRVWIPDIPGHPGLSSTVVPGFDRWGYVRWLEELLDGLGASRVTLVGASLGGLLAIQAAAALPTRIRAVVLLAPAGLTRVRITARSAWAAAQHRFGITAAGTRRFVATCLVGADAELPDRTRNLVVSFLRTSARGFVNRSGIPPLLPDNVLQAVATPVRLIVGLDDVVFPADRVVARARRRIPGLVGVLRMQGLGHALELCPEVVEAVGEVLPGDAPEANEQPRRWSMG